MATRLEQLNAAAKKAQKKRDAIAQEQKILAQKLNAEKRKQRNKRIFNWGGHLEGLLSEPELLTDDDVHRLLISCSRPTMSRSWCPPWEQLPARNSLEPLPSYWIRATAQEQK